MKHYSYNLRKQFKHNQKSNWATTLSITKHKYALERIYNWWQKFIRKAAKIQLPGSVLISSHSCSADELHNTSQEHFELIQFTNPINATAEIKIWYFSPPKLLNNYQ